MLDVSGDARLAGVRLAAFREDHGAVRHDLRVVRVEIAFALDDFLLRPRLSVVVGDAHPEVAAGRSVPGDIDVLTACGHRHLGLVGPAHVSVDVHRVRPGLAVIGGAHERGGEGVGLVGVQEDGIDVSGVRNDLDRGVVLGLRSAADADRRLRAEGLSAIRRDRERHPRRRAMGGAGLRLPVPGGEEVHVRRVRVGRDGRFPVVGARVQQLRPGPPRCRLARRLAGRKRSGLLGLLERVEALGGLVLLVLDLGAGSLPGVLFGRG